MRRGSSFLSLFHNVSILYGDRFSHYEDGHVGDATPMRTISHEMELPRFMLIDPEGAARRVLIAGAQLEALDKGVEESV